MNQSPPLSEVTSSSLPMFYREFLAERDEVMKHKWYLSENAGDDVGFDAALIDWVIQHREKWIQTRPDRLRGIQFLSGSDYK